MNTVTKQTVQNRHGHHRLLIKAAQLARGCLLAAKSISTIYAELMVYGAQVDLRQDSQQDKVLQAHHTRQVSARGG